MSREDIVSLHRFFSEKSKQEIQSVLENAFCDLDKKMELPEISKRYIRLCIPKDVYKRQYYIHLLPEKLVKSAGIDWEAMNGLIPRVELWEK